MTSQKKPQKTQKAKSKQVVWEQDRVTLVTLWGHKENTPAIQICRYLFDLIVTLDGKSMDQ